MTKYQNYKHYKLPITINPLDYGKLILKIDSLNLYILQISKTNIALLSEHNNINHVKIYKEGDFRFEYKDHKLNDNSFTRSLKNLKFTFKDNILQHSIVRTLVAIVLVLFWLFPENNLDLTMSGLTVPNIIRLRKVSSKFFWKDFPFDINNKVFTKILFESIFNRFLNKIENKFTDNNHMFILFKVKYIKTGFSTIGKIQRINKSDKKWYIDFVLENMKFKSEYYNETQIESFIFSYGFKNSKIENKENLNINVVFQKYNKFDLAISMNPIDYGRLVIQNKIESGINYIIQNDKDQTINFTKFDKYNEVEFFKSGIILVKFKDIFLSETSFLREIDNKKYYFENGTQILFTSEMKTKFISKTIKVKNLVSNFITLDIETYIHENSLVPYLICYYDGKNTYTFGLWDYDSVEMMILDCLESILIRKYNGYKLYIHNMAKFDIIFLLKYLVKLGHVTPIIHNGRIISINLNYGNNLDYRIQFKDSYLLLLASLAKLTRGFMVDTLKSVFPYLFVNENNLDYIGSVPDIKYFDNKINLSEYNNYKSNFNNNWDLKNETIKYCELDVISLYQVIFKFSELVFSLFGKNIHRYPTLPSLAFAIFRTSFMENDIIPQLSGKIATDIRQGYTGGAVDMYIARPPRGTKIYCYDVNSLYPYVMSKFDMPVGKPIYFEGDIRQIDKDAFGFFYCNIIAPDNLKHPILQTHVNTNGGTRTVAPLGSWNDMIFSCELDNAVNLGYKFNILWGYKFQRKNIFKNYVDNLYNMRLNYSKSDPLNYIAKILLNSLYGRFGMDDNFEAIDIIHKDFINDFENKFLDLITEKIELDEYFMIFYNKIEDNSINEESSHNVSIAIAAAITSYARIHMSQFKNNPLINLYYSDTDSIYIDKPLGNYLIDPKVLGKLKLEHICKQAIFLSPKVYYIETIDNEIIYKVKGLKHEVKLTITDFKNLLNKDGLIIKAQNKWIRNLSEGNINILNQVYTLKATENKRELIYNKNNKLVGTKSFKIKELKLIQI